MSSLRIHVYTSIHVCTSLGIHVTEYGYSYVAVSTYAGIHKTWLCMSYVYVQNINICTHIHVYTYVRRLQM